MSATRIIDELLAGTRQHLAWAELSKPLNDPTIGIHLAVMAQPFLDYLLDGSKTVESRFSANQIAPYQRVATGDLVLLKAGPVVGSFTVSTTTFLALHAGDLDRIRDTYAGQIRAEDDEFWIARAGKRYASLLGVTDVRALPPVAVSKRDMRGWAVLRLSTSAQSPRQPSLL